MVGHRDRPVTQIALRAPTSLLAGRPVKASWPHQLRRGCAALSRSLATQKTLRTGIASLQVPGEIAVAARGDETLMPTLEDEDVLPTALGLVVLKVGPPATREHPATELIASYVGFAYSSSIACMMVWMMRLRVSARYSSM